MYFVAAPLGLLLWLLGDFVIQRMTSHFVDVHALQRRALLLALGWTMLGWYLEAEAAQEVARLLVECQGEIETRFLEWQTYLLGVLG